VLQENHPEHPGRWHDYLLSSGHFRSHYHRRSYFRSSQSIGKEDAAERPGVGSLQSPFLMDNAYLRPDFEAHRPLFTTKTDDFSGWIDHVWISRDLDVSHVISPPIPAGDLTSSIQSRSFPPIPNAKYPSDHIPVGVVVDFAKSTTKYS